MKWYILIAIIIFMNGCKNNTPPVEVSNNLAQTNNYFEDNTTGIKTGGVKIIPITSNNRTFNIWTKRIGNNSKVKVLLLNGGPGCTHEYFECFESFLPRENIEFIYYDQLGCGNSDNPNDTTYWDLARFVEEVEQVRVALNLDSNNFVLLGHSWGGILAMEYAAKYQQHLKGLIISDMMADCIAYGKYADEVLSKKIKPEVLNEIRKIEAAKDFNNPRYMELLNPNFYNQFICRIPIKEWPEPMTRSLNKINNQLYVCMQGPSEFGIAGRLAKWNRSGDLKNYKMPTLVIGATHDTMDPEYMKWMASQIPKGSFHLCNNGSHMCMWDDQQKYFEGLIPFLKKLEAE